MVVQSAECKRDDRIAQGRQGHKPSDGLEHPLGYFNGSFVVFRGAPLTREWVADWKDCVGVAGMAHPRSKRVEPGLEDKPFYIHMQGHTSTSESFRVALEFGRPSAQLKDRVPTLFVIAIQNYRKYPGFRMNKPEFTAYPREQEVLLSEGANVFVAHVEEHVVHNKQLMTKEQVQQKKECTNSNKI